MSEKIKKKQLPENEAEPRILWQAAAVALIKLRTATLKHTPDKSCGKQKYDNY